MKFFLVFAQNISEGSYICAEKGEISQKDLWTSSETNPKLGLLYLVSVCSFRYAVQFF